MRQIFFNQDRKTFTDYDGNDFAIQDNHAVIIISTGAKGEKVTNIILKDVKNMGYGLIDINYEGAFFRPLIVRGEPRFLAEALTMLFENPEFSNSQLWVKESGLLNFRPIVPFLEL
jgi:hypothetical protein